MADVPESAAELAVHLAPGRAVHVRKLRPDGSQAYAWDGEVLRCDSSGIVLRAEFNVPLVEREYATFRQGDVFHEFYYWDRPYNVFHIAAPDGALKGWYANLGLPAELDAARGELTYVDLALDVWVNPDGSYTVLDADELAELLPTLPTEVQASAAQGEAAVLALAASGELPRWDE